MLGEHVAAVDYGQDVGQHRTLHDIVRHGLLHIFTKDPIEIWARMLSLHHAR